MLDCLCISASDLFSTSVSSRLYPADRPCPYLAKKIALPRSFGLWEGSRFCVDASLSPEMRLRIIHETVLNYGEETRTQREAKQSFPSTPTDGHCLSSRKGEALSGIATNRNVCFFAIPARASLGRDDDGLGKSAESD